MHETMDGVGRRSEFLQERIDAIKTREIEGMEVDLPVRKGRKQSAFGFLGLRLVSATKVGDAS